MKLKELNAKEIIKMVLGDERVPVKSEEELALLLKKRMTKKRVRSFKRKGFKYSSRRSNAEFKNRYHKI